MLCGRRRRRTTAVKWLAGAARPQLCQRLRLQFRSRPVFLLGWGQAAVVLQDSPHLWAAHSSTSAGRSIQLPRWFRELAGWLECRQKRMVLSDAWQGLPESGRWLRRRCRRRTQRAIRLRRRICQLDGRLERRQEGLVLFEQGQGLPTSSWRMCLSELEVGIHPGSGAGALRHLRVPLTGAVWTAVAWKSPALAFAPSSGSGASMLVPSVLLESAQEK